MNAGQGADLLGPVARVGRTGGEPNDSGSVAPIRSVVVDARGLGHSGIGRYLGEVLTRLLPDPRFGRFKLLGHPREVEPLVRESGCREKVTVIPFPYPFYSASAHLRWAFLAARGVLRSDIAWFPHYDVPLIGSRGRSVVVVHDLAHFVLDGVFPPWKRLLASVVLRRAVTTADRVLVVSESTRRDLSARHPSVAGRVAVVPCGVDPRFSEPLEPSGEPRAAAYRPYLLCVGNRKPHKNLVAGVEVLARLRRVVPELRLVLVGARFAEDDGVATRARERGVSDAVVALDDVGDDELRILYSHAECLLFPSLFEGFGLPVLEAMASGTPVVASNRAAIPEVAGDAAILVDPEDHHGMASAVARVLTDPRLRAGLVDLGESRAAQFTWDRTAEGVADALLAAHSRGGAREG